MRKLASIVFVLSLLLVPFTQILYPRAASAENVWAYSSSRDDYYVQTHLIKDIEIGFKVPVKLVVNGRLGHNRIYIFRYMNDDKYGEWYVKYADSTASYKPVRGNKWSEAVFDACAPYSKYAKRYPRKH